MHRSRLARLERCEGLLGGRGEVVVIAWHPCQTIAYVEDLAAQQLGRPWRRQDVLVVLEQDQCPQGPHHHAGQRIVVSPRTD
jgi:hypothetical protein